MATLVLGAVGASLGGAFSGTALGLSGAVIGRAVGATVGRVVDQAVLGQGAEAVESGRVERFKITGASEGSAIPRAFGRVKLSGQVIWATQFQENRQTTGGGGKGQSKAPKQTTYSYSVSLALALCEGRIRRVSRVWADGVELARSSLQLRVYEGSEDQLPDALIEAVEGQFAAPAYRGTAYVVIEDLDLTPFGNRVPQLSFEVVRHAVADGQIPCAAELISGVALIPGSGEYALATTPVHYNYGGGVRDSANQNTAQTETDFQVAIRDLQEELPNLKSASLIVSWFGSDLRCGHCRIRPKVEQREHDGTGQPWAVSGTSRANAVEVPRAEGRPLYGGTPSDASVVEAIRYLRDRGIDVTFYPFILMDQLAGNGLPDPYGQDEQPALPWRGRITTEIAPGRPGTTDRSTAASGEVDAFFGAISSSALRTDDRELTVHSSTEEWSYRRFILHYARLCALAGGVETFCIGSEMRSLTTIRDANDNFPAVAALIRLARDVRAILPHAKISYAADWSEYFGYRPDHADAMYFHLDPLWADDSIDFIGIDNYMPMADWRDGPSHADDASTSDRLLTYLTANVEGGEGYEWFYANDDDRTAQRRTMLRDDAYGEHWLYRYKDLTSWWSNAHHDRIDGIRAASATAWQPRSKPIRFIEYGCAAIDRGANQPNKFIDQKSSESSLPWFSNGQRDDSMQQQYLRALLSYWGESATHRRLNDDRTMVDLDHSFAWAWDTRPWPYFPRLSDHWTDSDNHARGHWLTGRSADQPLELVVGEICRSAGLTKFDTSALHGVVKGYVIAQVQTGRADLQPLLMAYGLDAVEREGVLTFRHRSDARSVEIDTRRLVPVDDGTIRYGRLPSSEASGTVVVVHHDSDNDAVPSVVSASSQDVSPLPISETDLPLSLSRSHARTLAHRFLEEAQISRDTVGFDLPPSLSSATAGDLLTLDDGKASWRVDRVDDTSIRRIHAVRTEPALYRSPAIGDDESPVSTTRPIPAMPIDVDVLDLPLLRPDDDPHSPYLAAAGTPWPGSIAIYTSREDSGYELTAVHDERAIAGETQNIMQAASAGVWDNGPHLLVRFGAEGPTSISDAALLSGGNAAAIGDPRHGEWEVFQFRDAQPLGGGVWALTKRLRGQRGTEAACNSAWSAGSRVVLLNGAIRQMPVTRDLFGLPRHHRIGPARLPVSDRTYAHIVHTPRGEGLRPYRPVHLRATRSGHLTRVSWIRRSRYDQAVWDSADIPLGELREEYLVRILRDDRIVLERQVSSPYIDLSIEEMMALPEPSGDVVVAVAQMSDEVGPGHWSRTSFQAVSLLPAAP